ncbi:MAG: hypothetical protein JOY79_02655, partial [Acidobacteriaceae bacterium]|nr:hypothetical protein [Acidobacteriaceae bacterium]
LLSGAFPQWDPYQFMGMPAAASGIYALTYPLTYLSYIFSRYLLRTEFLTIEVFVIGHLLLGYFATIWAARVMKVRTSVAVLAALCCVLSGYALLASRNWYYMSPVFLWVPLMAGAIWKLVTRPQLKWVVLLGVAGGMFFHAGNAQMWSYSLLLFGLAAMMLWVGGTIRFRQVVAIASGLLLAVGIAAPLLIVQLYTTKGVFRPNLITEGKILLETAAAFLVPGRWLGIANALDWGGGSPIVYSGTLFVALALVLLATTIPYRWARQDLGRNVWIACAIAAFLLGAGSRLPFWPALQHLPGFANFRLPFKFIALVDIFMALGGAVLLERLLRHARRAAAWELVAFVTVLALLGFNCTLSRTSFYSYTISYSDAPSEIRSYLQPGSGEAVRFLPIFPLRSRMSTFERGYPFDLAGLGRLYSVSGYDTLADLSPSFIDVMRRVEGTTREALSELGVRYVLVSKLAEHPVLDKENPCWLEGLINVPPGVLDGVKATGQVVASDNDLVLYKIPEARPLAFATNDPRTRLPIRFSTSGAAVELPRFSAPTSVTVNVHCRRGFAAYADSKRVPHTCDAWQRIAVNVPANTARLEVRFQPPWLAGFGIGLVMSFASIALAMLALSSRLPVDQRPVPQPESTAVEQTVAS